VQTFTATKTLWVMQDVCWNFLNPATLNPGQLLHRAHVITTTSGRNAIVLQRCCIQLPTHRENATTWFRSGTRLAFCGIAIRDGKAQYVIKLSSSFQLYIFYIKELMKKVQNCNQGTVFRKHHPSQHELLTRFGGKKFYGERSQFLSNKSVSLAIHKP